MKKVLVLSVFFIIIANNGCEKKEVTIDSVSILERELISISKSEVYPSLTISFCNLNNNYDNWGEALFYGVSKVMVSYSKSDINSKDFKDQLIQVIPKELLVLDTTGVNLNKVNIIFKEFTALFIKRNINDAISLSLKMEDHLTKSKLLSDFDKAYILKMVSMLRYSTFYVISRNTKSDDGSFERCWKRKLQEMEDSGFFTQLACITSWPVCFGAMLADCGLEELKEHRSS